MQQTKNLGSLQNAADPAYICKRKTGQPVPESSVREPLAESATCFAAPILVLASFWAVRGARGRPLDCVCSIVALAHRRFSRKIDEPRDVSSGSARPLIVSSDRTALRLLKRNFTRT